MADDVDDNGSSSGLGLDGSRAAANAAAEMDLETLAEKIAELGAHIDAAERQFLAYLQVFDEREGWFKQGFKSAAHWLSWRLGIDARAAREKVRIARALKALPAIDTAFAAGEISYSKVRAMTRVATPKTDEELLNIARHTTGADLERVCRTYRGVNTETSTAYPRLEQRRFVRAKHLETGMVRIEVQLPADEAELVLETINDVADRLQLQRTESQSGSGSRPEPAAGSRSESESQSKSESESEPESKSVSESESESESTSESEPESESELESRSDSRSEVEAEAEPGTESVVAVESQPEAASAAESEAESEAEVESQLEVEAEAEAESEAEAEDESAAAAIGSVTQGDRKAVDLPAEPELERRQEVLCDALVYLCELVRKRPLETIGGSGRDLMVHVDAGQLQREGTDLAGMLSSGEPITGDVLRRIACDTAMVTVMRGREGSVLDVGRKQYSIPPAIRRALRIRDRCCRFPGCGLRRHVDGHHIKHWANGGETSLGNLVLLCRYHHRLVHEEGFAIELTEGGFLFRDPSGKAIETAPHRPLVPPQSGLPV